MLLRVETLPSINWFAAEPDNIGMLERALIAATFCPLCCCMRFRSEPPGLGVNWLP